STTRSRRTPSICLARSTVPCSGSRKGRTAPAGRAVRKSAPSAWTRCPTRSSASTANARRSAVERARAAGARRPRGVEHGCADAGLGGRASPRGARAAVGRARRGGAGRDRGRPADEAPRLEPARARRVAPRGRAVRDPSRPELRDRLRPVLERDGRRHGADRAGGGLDAGLLRPLGRAAPRAAGRARAPDRRLDVQSHRPGAPWSRHRLSRPALLAGFQPGRLLHRDRRRDPVPGAAARRDLAPAALLTAQTLVVPAEAAGERLDRFLAGLPEIGSRGAAERLIESGAAT